MIQSLDQLQQRLGYEFDDLALLKCALTHRSLPGALNNERLEFLGDAVLSHIVAEALFQQYSTAREGELSRMRAMLVCGDRLADMAKELSLGAYLTLGMGEKKSGGSERRSILANAFEALVGAVYLDGGMDRCREFVMAIYGDNISTFSQVLSEKDAKSSLQEWLQRRQLPLPLYEAVALGKAHSQTFHVVCRVEGLPYKTEGTSTSRRRAEQVAAQAYLELLDDNY